MYRYSIAAILVCAPALAVSQSADEEALMREVYEELNPRSIAENIEHCGYVGYTAEGDLAISPPTPGDESSCLSDDPDNLDVVIASYHTHGGYSYDYDSEIPSGTDMETDEEEGIDGWVATPGGRLWYIDTTDMETWQVCGIGCLPSDPDFVPGDSGVIEQSYTYEELVIKLEE